MLPFSLDALTTADGIISLVSLTALEVVLGIDNIIFVSIVASKLPKDKQKFATNIGLLAATVIRIALLFLIQWIRSLQADLFTIFGTGISGKDIILIIGGLFLIAKSTSEIHAKIEGHGEEAATAGAQAKNLAFVIVQIVFINLIFSFDSILTAIGLVQDVTIMMISIIVSLFIMVLFINKINAFVNEHPTVKMLALSFLILVGVLLVAEAFETHIPKGYVYFAMAFAFAVELLNMRMRKKSVQHPDIHTDPNRFNIQDDLTIKKM